MSKGKNKKLSPKLSLNSDREPTTTRRLRTSAPRWASFKTVLRTSLRIRSSKSGFIKMDEVKIDKKTKIGNFGTKEFPSINLFRILNGDAML